MSNKKRVGLTFLPIISGVHLKPGACGNDSVQLVVQKSAAANSCDWQAQAEFSGTEREVRSKVDENGHAAFQQSKTHENVMIEGSPYVTFWVNDEPLSGAQKVEEQDKLDREIPAPE